MSRQNFVQLEIVFLLALPAWALLNKFAGSDPGSFTSVYLIVCYHLLTGWAFFLSRVLPKVVVDWFSVGVASTCLFGLCFGLHFFCAWFHQEVRLKIALRNLGPNKESPTSPIWKFRTTLSILGVIVLMFAAGIFAVGGFHQLVWLRTRP